MLPDVFITIASCGLRNSKQSRVIRHRSAGAPVRRVVRCRASPLQDQREIDADVLGQQLVGDDLSPTSLSMFSAHNAAAGRKAGRIRLAGECALRSPACGGGVLGTESCPRRREGLPGGQTRSLDAWPGAVHHPFAAAIAERDSFHGRFRIIGRMTACAPSSC